jgi:hypothetical protein
MIADDRKLAAIQSSLAGLVRQATLPADAAQGTLGT